MKHVHLRVRNEETIAWLERQPNMNEAILQAIRSYIDGGAAFDIILREIRALREVGVRQEAPESLPENLGAKAKADKLRERFAGAM